MLEEFGDADLLYSYNYQGGFTPKQSQRMINTIKNEALTEIGEDNKLKQAARLKYNTDARTKANTSDFTTSEASQTYFRGEDTRTDEEIDEQFNAQPGLF